MLANVTWKRGILEEGKKKKKKSNLSINSKEEKQTRLQTHKISTDEKMNLLRLKFNHRVDFDCNEENYNYHLTRESFLASAESWAWGDDAGEEREAKMVALPVIGLRWKWNQVHFEMFGNVLCVNMMIALHKGTFLSSAALLRDGPCWVFMVLLHPGSYGWIWLRKTSRTAVGSCWACATASVTLLPHLRPERSNKSRKKHGY